MAEPEQPTQKTEPDEASERDDTAPAPESHQPVTGDASDPVTDKAIDDITRTESDDELKSQDEAAGKVSAQRQGGRFRNAWHDWWHNPVKRWGTIAAVVVILAVLFAIPLTRYDILGVALKSSVTVETVDSKTGTPVSSAKVEFAGKTAETQGNGKTTLNVHLGSGMLKASKKYYATYSHSELVKTGNNSYKIKLVALGRQVKVKVANKISGKPVSGAKLTAGAATAKTDKNGLATIVLSSGTTTEVASVSLSGYNDTKVTIDANGDLTKDTFSVTPAGKLYFLSNLSGSIDVVKTNLDGTDRQTVLAGTGNEDPNSTSLLASRDWKYLGLLSKRSGDNASVYLIDTTNGDKLTTVDEGNATFSLVGWSGDRLIYTVDRSQTVSDWQPNQEALKSFDPTTGHTLLLDQTQGGGSSSYNYVKQSFGSVYLIGDQIVYAKTWQGYNVNYTTNVLNGKQSELDTIGADGTGHRTLKSFAPDSYPSGIGYVGIGLATRLYEPGGLYIDFSNNNNDNFYEYEAGKVTSTSDVNSDTFYQNPYPTYLLSPSGNQTFWAEQRDGKNTLFTGDDNAKDPKQIASLSDYNAYAWFTDNYLLVSKNSSELYIMPATGGTPIKITDYYKPAINYQGYGGGYGGL